MTKTKERKVDMVTDTTTSKSTGKTAGKMVAVGGERHETSKALAPLLDFFPAWAQRWGFPDVSRMFAGSEMKLEEYRDNGTLVVRAELPGVDPDKDIDVTVHDGLLSIRAERTASSKSQQKDHFQSEFHYGAFHRTLPLPTGTGAEAVEATYTDGILEVRLPVDDGPRTRKVQITHS